MLGTNLKVQSHPTPGEGAVQELTIMANPDNFLEHPTPASHARFPFIFFIFAQRRLIPDSATSAALAPRDKLQQMCVCPK